MAFSFDSQYYRYASRREVLFARQGMVCTSQALAAQAGLDMLKKGGNAVDAALATAIALTVLEPVSNGLGSDAFALVWMDNNLYGLNGSGPAPQSLSWEAVTAAGYTSMPDRGWIPVTVPGAPSAWAALHKRFGRLSFDELFEPAISYAEKGFPVQPTMAALWNRSVQEFAPYGREGEFAGLYQTFFKDHEYLQAGDSLCLPDHAKTLWRLADTYCEDFYRGTLADQIDAFSRHTGGCLRKRDLEAYQAQWVDPIHTSYKDYDVWEIPPNGHGLVALMALNIMKGFACGSRDTADTFHKQIESMKLAFTDGRTYIADPSAMHTSVDYWLSETYAAQRRSIIGEQALEPAPIDPDCGGTVYLCTADGEGNMVSFIQSNFKGFGSGVVVPGTGIALNDRGNNFSLDPASDNVLCPGKKPYHTIIPGFLTKQGKAVGPFGVMGGFMQPQGHMQVLMNLLEFGMNPQEALDAPRWQWIGGKRIEVEPSVPAPIIEALKKRGHDIIVNADSDSFGRGQMILRNEKGVLAGATEPRADGCVAIW